MYHPELRPELIHDGVLPEAGEIRSQLDRRRLSGQLLAAAAQLIGQPLDHEVLGAPPGGAGDFRIEAAARAGAVGGDHAGPEAPPPPAQRAGRGALLPPPGERSEGRGGAEEEGGGLTAAGAEPEARGGRRLQNHLAAAAEEEEGGREGRHWPGT